MVYWTLDYFKILYNEYAASGVSLRVFCKEQGIKENRFYYWVKTLKRQAVSALDSPRGFIPLSSGAVNSLTRSFSNSQPQAKEKLPVNVQGIKIAYPNGVVLHLDGGSDLDTLKQLITLKP